MSDEQLKSMLDQAEELGWKRGRLEILQEILLQMEKEKMLTVSYKLLKIMFETYEKI